MTTTSVAAPPVEVRGLTKQYGHQRVVDDLSFSAGAGRVTGFLGPNGAGKTTTLRMLVGLTTPTAGEARVYGRPYADLDVAAQTAGVLIDASGFHPGRRIAHELAIRAVTARVDDGRVDEVLHTVGLEAAAKKRVAALSLGMRQRLGLAAALLGWPRLLLLDEPANGLDPAGMHWLRSFLRAFADDGGAVVVSSHVLAELELFADDVVVINHGRLVTVSSMASLGSTGAARVFVRTPKPDALRKLLTRHDGRVERDGDGLVVSGLTAEAIGDLSAEARIPLHQLRTDHQSLEDIFLELTADEEAIR